VDSRLVEGEALFDDEDVCGGYYGEAQERLAEFVKRKGLCQIVHEIFDTTWKTYI